MLHGVRGDVRLSASQLPQSQSGPVVGALKDFKKATRTAGNLTLNSTTWANVDTGIDLVMAAAVGDEIEVGVSGRWNPEAVEGYLNVATIVSGSPVNYVMPGGAADAGAAGWMGDNGEPTHIGAAISYTVQAADVSAGTVTLRLRYRTSTATNKVFVADPTQPFHWWARNLGQVGGWAVLQSGSTALLGVTHYRAGSDTNYDVTATSFADVDATNLAATFTAPASGNVLVRLSAVVLQTGANNSYFGLRVGAADVAATSGLITSSYNAGVMGMTWACRVTGLTPGNPYTWKWAAKVGAGTLKLFNGPTYGGLTMEVWSAP